MDVYVTPWITFSMVIISPSLHSHILKKTFCFIFLNQQRKQYKYKK